MRLRRLLFILLFVLIDGSLYAGPKNDIEMLLDRIHMRLINIATSYQRADEFSKERVESEIEELELDISKVKELLISSKQAGLFSEEVLAAYSSEINVNEARLRKLIDVHERTKVNSVYSADVFRNNLLEMERKAIQSEMKSRGLLDDKGDVPKQLRDYINIEQVNAAKELLAERLVIKGLSMYSAQLPSAIEHEAFYELDRQNSSAKYDMDQRAGKSDTSTKRAIGRIARRALSGTSLIFIVGTLYTDGVVSYESANNGVGYVGVGVVLAAGLLDLLDGYWTLKSRRKDIAEMIPARTRSFKERAKNTMSMVAERFKAMRMPSDIRESKQRMDDMFFSLLFAEAVGGSFYDQVLGSLRIAIKDVNSPIQERHKPVLDMMLRRTSVYSAEDILNKYMSFSNDTETWPLNIIERSNKAKEKAVEWYIALSLLDADKGPVTVSKVLNLSKGLPSDLAAKVRASLSNKHNISDAEKKDLILKELGPVKDPEEVKAWFSKIEAVVHSSGINTGKINKVLKIVEDMKKEGLISGAHEVLLRSNIDGSKTIPSSFLSTMSDVRTKTLAYFELLEKLQGADDVTDELIGSDLLSKEQLAKADEIINKPIYELDVKELHKETALKYGAYVPNISSTYSSSEIDDLLLEVLSRGEEISDELIVDIFGTEESESGLISYLYSHLDEVEDGKEIALLLCSYFGSSRAIDHRYITLRIIKTYQFLGLLGLDIKGSYERLTERLSSLPQVLDMEKFNQMVVSQRSTITRSIIK